MEPALLRRLIALGCLGLATAACTPTESLHGNLVTDTELKSIHVGVSKRDDVDSALGTPTAVGTFDKNTWYYVGSQMKQEAFFRPEPVDRRVIAVTFDDSGTVSKLKELGLKDGRSVVPTAGATPTPGQSMTILQQLVGNIGRFSGLPQQQQSGVGIPGSNIPGGIP